MDIDHLTYDQVVDLNNRVVARLKFLDQMRAHSAMLDFRIGEQVRFQPPGHDVVTGSGQQWKVSPTFLSKLNPAQGSNPSPTNHQKNQAKIVLPKG